MSGFDSREEQHERMAAAAQRWLDENGLEFSESKVEGIYLTESEVAERDLCEHVTCGSRDALTVYLTREQCLSTGGRCPTHGKEYLPEPVAVHLNLEPWQTVEETWHYVKRDDTVA